MKPFARLALAALCAMPVVGAIASPGAAQEAKNLSTFRCQQIGGYFATVAVNSNGRSAPMIVWRSQEFSDSGYTPQRRCADVTSRLNSVFQANGRSLRNLFLTVGPVNRHVVMCHVNSTRSGCNSNNVLFTLSQTNRPSSNSRAILENLFNTRVLSTGNPVQESGGQAYVSLEAVVEGLF
ncbi:MAG: COP23 domain-containing protein [Cyanobacteria bacterium]|nr:COP23 domain-containing protein [Cyanobacteriota bacterium]